MATSGGGTDVLGTLVVPGRGDGACPELAGRVEQARTAGNITAEPGKIDREATAPVNNVSGFQGEAVA
jgi:hypothetical protein